MKKIIYIIIFAFLLYSCKIHTFTENKKIKSSFIKIDSIKNYNSKINLVAANFMLNFIQDKSNNTFYGKFVLQKDTSIFIDITSSFGLTMAQCKFTPDSVFIFIPFKNELYCSDSSVYLRKFDIGLNYFSLQSLLTNKAFVYPYFNSFSNYSLSNNDTLIVLSDTIFNKRNSRIIDILHLISLNENFSVSDFFIKDFVLNKTLIGSYSSFQLINNEFIFPTIIELKIPELDSAYCKLALKNINFTPQKHPELNVKTNTHIINF